MVALMFAGQGSQQKGMGDGLFSKYAELTRKADDILGYSIEELCMEDPGGKLVQTQFTQPALYVVNALHYLEKKESGMKPDYVLGHSIGEFNSLHAAGVVDFETGLRLVKLRGELMGQAKGGGMAAVMGLAQDEVAKLLKENGFDNLYIANCNSPFQYVISGLKEDIVRAEEVFIANDVPNFKVLNVSGAFHTPFMEEARKEFEQFVDTFKYGEILIPIISNVTARPYVQENIKEYIVKQITSPVMWTESIRYLLAVGVCEFDEAGSQQVVKKLAKRIVKEAGPLDLSGEML